MMTRDRAERGWVRGAAALLGAALVACVACGGGDGESGRAQAPATGVPSLGAAEAGIGEGASPAAAAPAASVGGSPAAAAPTVVATARAGATAAPTRAAGAAASTAPGRGAAAAVATPPADSPDPCALVTLAEAETALGVRPFPGRVRRSRDSAEVRCTYDTIGATNVIVSVWKGTEARPVYDLRREAYAADAEEVRGLGDRAFRLKNDEVGWINVLKGDLYLSVTVAHESLSTADLQARSVTLARAALGRL